MPRRARSALAAAGAALLLAACKGAPSLAVAGAYFPAWLACAIAGLVAAMVAHAVFVATGLARVLPLQLFVCCSIGVMAGALLWYVWIGT